MENKNYLQPKILIILSRLRQGHPGQDKELESTTHNVKKSFHINSKLC
jgi:hypothetical protein